MRNSGKIIVVVLAVILAAFLGYYFFNGLSEKRFPEKKVEISDSDKQKIFEPQVNDEGDVSVKVEPQNIGMSGAKTWDFKITFDTHVVELAEDVVEVSELIDGKGNIYKPLIWEGGPPGGHHREGVLKFNSIDYAFESIELKIKKVGGINERNFKWSLK